MGIARTSTVRGIIPDHDSKKCYPVASEARSELEHAFAEVAMSYHPNCMPHGLATPRAETLGLKQRPGEMGDPPILPVSGTNPADTYLPCPTLPELKPSAIPREEIVIMHVGIPSNSPRSW
ncbi:hypothetical protein PV04_00753 [Phialophora macrospora]|uniref:Uncharacterized protein n=1 Tax=Phialophora macrospora TaxID=1851006 RepID=A0A0D2D4U2_9EURO|nr:hypothetical protein PV04_00753 [Phialophora macrospora]